MSEAIKDASFTGRINVVVSNNNTALNDITTTAMNEKVYIEDLKILSRTSEFLDIILDVQVKSVTTLNELMVALRMINNIISVSRA